MLHTPNSSMTVTFSEDTQGMEEPGPALLCLKATSPCLAVPKGLFQPLGTKAATTDQKSVQKLVQNAEKHFKWHNDNLLTLQVKYTTEKMALQFPHSLPQPVSSFYMKMPMN